MQNNAIHRRLTQLDLDTTTIEKVSKYIALNKRAFILSEIPLENLEIIVVFKNTGGYKIYKRVKGAIVVDKLDTSYIESRELVCISGWNIKKVYSFTFTQEGEDQIEVITHKRMRDSLFSLYEPTNLTYAINVESEGYKTTLTVDTSPLKGLTYTKLKECVDASFYRYNKRELHDKESQSMEYVLVDFT